MIALALLDDGPPTPRRMEDIAASHLEDGEIDRAIDIAEVMFRWWNHHPTNSTFQIGSGCDFWMGFLVAAWAARQLEIRRGHR